MTLSNRLNADTAIQGTDVLGPVDVTGIPQTNPGAASQSISGGSYEIISKLGEGAMGEVSLARDPVLRRTVALKSLLPQVSRDSSLLQRFVGEMQITAQLDHPHIVPVYGFERRDTSMSYAMKLVQGKELYHLLEETKALVEAGKPIDAEHSLQTRLEIFVKVCDALAYAHSRGVIHRDVKPSNVMIGRFKEVYLVDWGIARQIGAAGSTQDRAAEAVADNAALQPDRTRLGATVGTPGYMSPEQAAGKNSELDGRSDLYALGLVLQEIVTLTPAVAGTTVELALVNSLQGKRAPMKAATIEVPRELAAIVDRACQLRPSDRYASVSELAADVRRYMNNEEVRALPDTLPRRLGRWLSTHRMLAMGLLAGTFLLGVAAAGGVWAYNQVVLAGQRNREVRLVEVQADSSTRAQQLDAALAGYQESLQRLAGAAGIMLEKGDVPPLDPLTEERFATGSSLEGLVDSAFYGKRVSFDWLVAARAPGADAAQMAQSFGALQTLGMALPRTMIDSLPEEEQRGSQSAQLDALAKTGAPIRRIAFTLEDGLSAAYPGMSGLSASADGRNEQLYQRAKRERGVVWGPPAPSGDQTMLLHCATTIHARDGRVLGVVELEIDAGRAIAAALAASSEQVEVSVLVDRTGKVLAQNAKDASAKEADSIADDQVRAAIARGESGYLATKRDGRDVVVTYQPLASMDWYLVTVADVAKLEQAKPSPSAAPVGIPTSTATARAPRSPLPPATQPVPVVTAPTTSASTSASASAAATVSAARSAPPVVRPRNPFEPWPIYQPKPPK